MPDCGYCCNGAVSENILVLSWSPAVAGMFAGGLKSSWYFDENIKENSCFPDVLRHCRIFALARDPWNQGWENSPLR